MNSHSPLRTLLPRGRTFAYLAPLALLSMAAGPCADKNIGSLDRDADPGAAADLGVGVVADAKPVTAPDALATADAMVNTGKRDTGASDSSSNMPPVGSDGGAGTCDPLTGNVLEYAASSQTAGWLVVIRPEPLMDYKQFRLFVGPTTRMVEQKVINVARAREGGTTMIDFVIDGMAGHVIFPPPNGAMSVATNPPKPSVTIGGVTQDIHTLTPAETPPAFTFVCL